MSESTWDLLTPDEREASGKGYDRPTTRDVVDDEEENLWTEH